MERLCRNESLDTVAFGYVSNLQILHSHAVGTVDGMPET